MVRGFTITLEALDGEGDDYSREIAFLEQFGHIRKRDKAHDGQGYLTQKDIVRHHYETHPSHPQFDADQQARLKALGQRISAQEGFLRSKGINPCRMGTAGQFDKLAI